MDNKNVENLLDVDISNNIKILSKKCRNVMMIIIISMILCPTLGIIGANYEINILIVFCLISLGVCIAHFFIYNKASQKLKVFISENITNSILSEMFDVKEYNCNKSFGYKAISSAGLIYGWDRYSGNDLVRAEYKGYEVSFCDIHLEEARETKDKDGDYTTSYYTIFRGQWIVLDSNRAIASPVRLIARSAFSRINKNGTKKTLEGEIKTENLEFNNLFLITGEDNQTVFRILTPLFMEKLISLDKSSHAGISFCFSDKYIVIAINSKEDLFEQGGKAVENIELLKNSQREQLKYIAGILDELIQNDYLY